MQSTTACQDFNGGATVCTVTADAPVGKRFSVRTDWKREAQVYKWIMSERAGCDLGEEAIRRWVREHWSGYLRARWIEHLQGLRFWVELDHGDYNLLQNGFPPNDLLLDRILDRVKAGWENLPIIVWAIRWNLPIGRVVEILETIDINSRRLEHKFD
jgi:hypothetical protein